MSTPVKLRIVSEIEQSALARNGWVRIAFRSLLYASLLFFAGGLIYAALLSRRGRPMAWLVPEEVRSPLGAGGVKAETLADKAWARTLDAGFLAAAAAVAVAVAQGVDAAGRLSANGLSDYLLSNGAGLARVATVLAICVATLAARRSTSIASAWAALALLTIALGGHANSADPRVAAIVTDWIHLVAAAAWIGGIAQIALVWLPVVRGAGIGLRSSVMRAVLARFGKIALPAFLVVAVTGGIRRPR